MIERVKCRLLDYLDDHSIDARDMRKISCISRYHEDSTPSMAIIPNTDGKLLKCFGCNSVQDVFSAAHHLEGLPLTGIDFVQENVFVLAAKFGYDTTDITFTAEQVDEYIARKIYRAAAKIFSELSSDMYAERRGWTEADCRKYEIGTIANEPEFYAKVASETGVTEQDLVKYGLMEYKSDDKARRVPKTFGPNLLTFVIRDHESQPVGFVCRNYASGVKYLNTKGLRSFDKNGCPIYHKSEVLYGAHIASLEPSNTIHIFEGYADWVTAQINGLRNCVAMGGTAFTSEHRNLLMELGYTHINFVMDGDDTGYEKMVGKTDKQGDGYLYAGSGVEGLTITVTFLPFEEGTIKEDRDPDAWFQNHTVEEFLACTNIDAFDWELKRLVASSSSGTDIAEVMIDFLRNESNLIRRGEKFKVLSITTGIPIENLKDEFTRRFSSDTDSIVDEMSIRLSRAKNTRERIEIIDRYSTVLKNRGDSKVEDLSQKEVLDDFDAFVTRADSQNKSHTGFLTGFPLLDAAMGGGVPKTGEWLAFAGNSNVGKSAVVLNIGWNLVSNLENENLTVCYWALDDSRQTTYAKWLAQACRLPINWMLNPPEHIYGTKHEAKYREARTKLSNFLKTERVSVKGEETGNSVAMGERWIGELQERTGNNVILIVDSFHNVSVPGVTDERLSLVAVSRWLRRSTQKEGYSAIVTMECSKMGVQRDRPRFSDLMGSNKMSYDLKFCGMVHNDLHAKREEGLAWVDEYGNRKPYLEMAIEKNKLSEQKGDPMYRFHDACSILEELTAEESRFIKGSAILSGPPTGRLVPSLDLTSGSFEVGPEKKETIVVSPSKNTSSVLSLTEFGV